MKTRLILLIITFKSAFLQAQIKSWTAADKQKLIENYRRTRAEFNAETKNLSHAQWVFKEDSTKWNIAQVSEHLYNWSLITQQNVRFSIQLGENPELAKRSFSDSTITTFIWEERPHTSPYHTIPTGLITDDNNRLIFNVKYDEIIDFIQKSDKNFRLFIRNFNDEYMEDVVQQFIIHYGHVDRHLRQIRKIKAHPKFPK